MKTPASIPENVCARIAVVLLLALLSGMASGQSVFQLFRDDELRADEYYAQDSYAHALQLYLTARPGTVNHVKVARCYYKLHQYALATTHFELASVSAKAMGAEDEIFFAECLAACKRYPEALSHYQAYLRHVPDDEMVTRKIWRIRNLQYLFEDSLHFSIRKLGFNSSNHEFAATPFQNGIVFISNRHGATPFDAPDALTGQNKYNLYYAAPLPGNETRLFNDYRKPIGFKGLSSRDHTGPVAFFASSSKAVYARSSATQSGRRPLQLFFASRTAKSWREDGAFPFNGDFDLTDPCISDDGKTLFFSSNMKGGFGGKDIYKSVRENDQWSLPVNLGPEVNTRFDESFPHINGNHLYFSSNGHPGMGGLDVFKVPLLQDGLGEVSNPGYPLNSSHDDFALFFRTDGQGAYISSNRGGSDDIYEIDIDLQSYPVQINGVLKSKEFTLSDSSSISSLPFARMYLVDHTRDIIVSEVTTDGDGNFQLSVPYFSQYKLRVVEKSGEESIVSLQIPRQKKSDYSHEIVVVKDAFHTPDE